MYGLGTLINTGAIVAGGLAGMFTGRLLGDRRQEGLLTACAVSVMFIGTAGCMEGMLTVEGGVITAGRSMLLTVCLALGTLAGELLDIESWFLRFGEWLKVKTGSAKDRRFTEAFVSASLTVSIGAMAVLGPLRDGLEGDWSLLATKAVLDLIIILVMTGGMGKGCIFSAIPVFVIEGLMTLCASLVRPLVTELAMDYLSLTGSVIIFCVGLNLIREKKIRTANMLPTLLFAVAAAFLPV